MVYPITGGSRRRPLCCKFCLFSITLSASPNFHAPWLLFLPKLPPETSLALLTPGHTRSLLWLDWLASSFSSSGSTLIPATSTQYYHACEREILFAEYTWSFSSFKWKESRGNLINAREKALSFSSRVANAPQTFSYSKLIQLFLLCLFPVPFLPASAASSRFFFFLLRAICMRRAFQLFAILSAPLCSPLEWAAPWCHLHLIHTWKYLREEGDMLLVPMSTASPPQPQDLV